MTTSELFNIDEELFDSAKALAKDIFPLHRSISGDGIDKAFSLLENSIPTKLFKFKTGQMVHDWKIPQSWQCSDCSVTDTNTGKAVIQFNHPLRVASHSIAVDKVLSGRELKKKLVSSEKYPNSLMHRYCYYESDWSISVTKEEFNRIEDNQKYKVLIDAAKYDGELQAAESIIMGKSDKKIFFLSHICHPAQFNDGLVGVLLNQYLYNYIRRHYRATHYNYYFLFVPETIGSIAYCSDKSRLDDAYFALFSEMTALDQPIHIQESYQPLDDINKILKIATRDLGLHAKFSPFLKVIRNDEKIFNAPGFDVPAASITRALGPGIENHPFFGYHTDLDTLDSANMDALKEVVKLYQYIIEIIEKDYFVHRLFDGIPMLSRHNLFVNPLVNRDMYNKLEAVVWLLRDDTRISDISTALELNFMDCLSLLTSWQNAGLVTMDMDQHKII